MFKLVLHVNNYKQCMAKKMFWFLVSARVASAPCRASAFLMFFLFCYETMSNCSQHCWIDWNSAVLCFKRLFHIGVWTFARFVRPLLQPPYFIQGKFGPRVYNVSRISLLAKKKKMAEKKARHHTDFEADRWSDTGDFFGGPYQCYGIVLLNFQSAVSNP